MCIFTNETCLDFIFIEHDNFCLLIRASNIFAFNETEDPFGIKYIFPFIFLVT